MLGKYTARDESGLPVAGTREKEREREREREREGGERSVKRFSLDDG